MKPVDSDLSSSPFRAVGLALCLLIQVIPVCGSEPPVLTCEPQTLHGVPGEPLQVRLSVESQSADPVTLHIPDVPLLALRAVEKIPLHLSKENSIIQERLVIWQGLEPGTVTITQLSAEIAGKQFPFPPLEITIESVPPEK